MRLTDRQARERLRKAMAEVGSQRALAVAHGIDGQAGVQTATSRGVTGRGPLTPVVLGLTGLSHDDGGDIHTAETAWGSEFCMIAIEASGEAGVAAAVALVRAVLRPG